MVESASFLAQVTFVRECLAAGFFARSVARHYERESLVAVLPLAAAIELPPVGLITVCGRRLTPVGERLLEALRAVAGEIAAEPAPGRTRPRARKVDGQRQ